MRTWRCLAPLPSHRHHPPAEVDVARRRARRARPPAARCRRAARARRRLGGRRRFGPRRRHRPRAGDGGRSCPRMRQTRVGGGGGQPHRRVGVDQTSTGDPLEIGPERRRRPSDGGLRASPGGQEGQIAAKQEPVTPAGARVRRRAQPTRRSARCRWRRPEQSPGPVHRLTGGAVDLPGHGHSSTGAPSSDRVLQ